MVWSEKTQACKRCLSAPYVQKIYNVVKDLSLGGRLQKYWSIWQNLDTNTKVVSILKKGYALLLKMRPPVTRSPLIVSGYANPIKNNHLKKALQSLMNKLVV